MTDQFQWTPERIELALRLSASGRSGGEIAKMFGTTRNTIIGKLSREKIKRGLHVRKPTGPHYKPRAPATRTPGMPALNISKQKEPAPPVVIWPMIEKGTGTPCCLVDLCGCKWPIGETPGQKGRHIFCNAPRPVNSPYCETHRRKAGEKYQIWSPTDDALIRRDWRAGLGKDRLCQVLRRPKAAIARRAEQLGLVG